jgi:hypothetical protein
MGVEEEFEGWGGDGRVPARAVERYFAVYVGDRDSGWIETEDKLDDAGGEGDIEIVAREVEGSVAASTQRGERGEVRGGELLDLIEGRRGTPEEVVKWERGLLASEVGFDCVVGFGAHEHAKVLAIAEGLLSNLFEGGGGGDGD